LNRRAVVAAAAGAGAIWVAACGDVATHLTDPVQRPTTVIVSPVVTELAALDATVQLSAQVIDQNGHAMTGVTVTWSSSRTSVATVGASGLVTAAGNGTATVSAMAGTASGTAAVTVAQQVSTVTVTPPAQTLATGDTARLSAKAVDANGHQVAVAPFTWSSSNTEVATVDVSGLVTAVKRGTATITATAAEAAGSAVITATPPGVLLGPLLDSLVAAFVDEHDIGAAALSMTKDGILVYERVFGWKDRERTIPLPEDVMMRLASVTKPLTAAAVHELARDGRLDLDAFVFDLGQAEGGLLDIAPFPSIGDARLAEITVRHLLGHRGGWDRSIAGDLTFREIEIAEAMSVPSPPGRHNTVRYILGQPLQFDPGAKRVYANIGYMVLGLVIEEVSGTDYLSALFDRVLSPLGVRGDDVILGRTFPQDRSDREPWYDYGSWRTRNVFDPDGPRVLWPQGGWHHEALLAHGGLVASTRPILRFLDAYYVAGDVMGMRRRRSGSTRWTLAHSGGLPGTSTVAWQRGDGVNYVILFNKNTRGGYAFPLGGIIADVLDDTRIIWEHASEPPRR